MVIGEEERKIRQDPVGTGSALLKKVLGRCDLGRLGAAFQLFHVGVGPRAGDHELLGAGVDTCLRSRYCAMKVPMPMTGLMAA